MSQATRIVFCDCKHADLVPKGVEEGVLEKLTASGFAFENVADLCGVAAGKDPMLKRIAECGDAKIVACFPRALRWLFHVAGAPLPDDGVELLNMRRQSADEIVTRLLPDGDSGSSDDAVNRSPACLCGVAEDGAEPAAVTVAGSASNERMSGQPEGAFPEGWIPWFPVIDYDRCGNCKQCLSFCLFGVYAVDADERIEVRHPEQCKTNCPACARVCPNAAIIFPKYGKSPINGDEVREEDVRHDAVKVDVTQLFDGGAHAALRARGDDTRKRFSTEKVESGSTGEYERCRKKVQADLDIPDEVLTNVLKEHAKKSEPLSDTSENTEHQARAGSDGDRQSPPSDTAWDI